MKSEDWRSRFGNESWLETLEKQVTRKSKVKKALRKDIDDKIEQLRLIEEDIENIIDDALNTGQPSREDVEWALLDAKLNGAK
jgi:hypothetical protein|tara:strand:- start:179 stop:427 length:249 start_codon:yes stop_codon:yes gene_type:complete